MQKLKIKKIHKNAVIPRYMTDGSACFDITIIETVTLLPGQIKAIKTGLKFEIPVGYEMQVRQRSGISAYHPNYISNAPGTIDSDYRGELFILTVNNSQYNWTIESGIRFAQCKISKVEKLPIEVVNELSETKRGSGAFGHTGMG